MDCTEILQLPEESLSYRHQQDRKARRQKMPKFRYGSSPRWSVEQPCGYRGDNLAVGGVRQSHESLQEKLLVSEGYVVLYWVIDEDPLLNRREIAHTWIVIVNNMKVALCRVECTPMDDNIWVSHPFTLSMVMCGKKRSLWKSTCSDSVTVIFKIWSPPSH